MFVSRDHSVTCCPGNRCICIFSILSFAITKQRPHCNWSILCRRPHRQPRTHAVHGSTESAVRLRRRGMGQGRHICRLVQPHTAVIRAPLLDPRGQGARCQLRHRRCHSVGAGHVQGLSRLPRRVVHISAQAQPGHRNGCCPLSLRPRSRPRKFTSISVAATLRLNRVLIGCSQNLPRAAAVQDGHEGATWVFIFASFIRITAAVSDLGQQRPCISPELRQAIAAPRGCCAQTRPVLTHFAPATKKGATRRSPKAGTTIRDQVNREFPCPKQMCLCSVPLHRA